MAAGHQLGQGLRTFGAVSGRSLRLLRLVRRSPVEIVDIRSIRVSEGVGARLLHKVWPHNLNTVKNCVGPRREGRGLGWIGRGCCNVATGPTCWWRYRMVLMVNNAEKMTMLVAIHFWGMLMGHSHTAMPVWNHPE